MKIAILRCYRNELGLAGHWPSNPPADIRDVEFQFDRADGADHVVVLNGLTKDTRVFCGPDRIWAMIQEPPDPLEAHIYEGQQAFSRIYSPDPDQNSDRHHPFWGALEWLIGRSYDELVSAPYPAKERDLTWITSSSTYLRGHRKRMRFLERLQADQVPLELWGRGFRDLPSKWDALSISRYSMAFENFGRGIYWSEKISDSFLAYATPFYYGARDIDRYFPRNSYIPIDPDDPLVTDRIKDVLNSNFHEENLGPLLEARDLCLNKYNTLFYIAREAKAYRAKEVAPRWVTIRRLRNHRYPLLHSADVAVRNFLKSIMPAGLLSWYRQQRDRRETLEP